MQLSEFPISSLTGVRVVQEIAAGEFSRTPLLPELFTGIEIEGEDVSFSYSTETQLRSLGWALHHDDSLRRDGMEFVLDQPLNGEKLGAAVTGIFNIYREGTVQWRPSPRAGTHIHLNASHKTVGFVQAFTALVYCVDELIFTFADEDRRWCSYCNSLNTLPPSVLQALLVNREYEDYNGWQGAWPISARDRYYGCNITSLAKYGTVELRYFPTPTSEEQLWLWLDLCHALYRVAEAYEGEDNPAGAVIDRAMNDTAGLLAEIKFLAKDDEAIQSVQEAAQELQSILEVVPDNQRTSDPVGNLEGLWQRVARRAEELNFDAHRTMRSTSIPEWVERLHTVDEDDMPEIPMASPYSYFDHDEEN